MTTSSILIVDDNADDIELTTLAVETAGREAGIKAVSSGEAALRYLRNGNELPALVLLDLKMAGMSGIEMLREMRADNRLKYIPVVIVTSSSLEEDRKAVYDAGANSFLHKAFDMQQFSRDIDTCLQRYL
jgi:two-component system response regulator